MRLTLPLLGLLVGLPGLGACLPLVSIPDYVVRDTDNPATDTDTPDPGPDWDAFYASVDLSENHLCASNGSDKVECWARDGFDPLTPPADASGPYGLQVEETLACGLLGPELVCWGAFRDGPIEESRTDLGPSPRFQLGDGWGCYTAGSAGAKLTCFGWEQGAPLTQAPPNQNVDVMALRDEMGCVWHQLERPVVCWGNATADRDGAPPGQYTEMALAEQFGCAINKNEGRIECWGAAPSLTPEGSFSQLVLGRDHGCAISTETERVECFGRDDAGETEAPEERFRSLAAAGDATCGITADQRLFCWGDVPVPSTAQ